MEITCRKLVGKEFEEYPIGLLKEGDIFKIYNAADVNDVYSKIDKFDNTVFICTTAVSGTITMEPYISHES